MITPAASDFWQAVGTVTHLAGACVAATVAVVLFGRRARFGRAGLALVWALALTAAWCLAVAVGHQSAAAASLAEAFRNLAYLFAVYRLFSSDGRHASVAAIRPVVVVLIFVELLQPGLLLIESRVRHSPEIADLFFHINVLFRLMVTVGGLVLVHNLYTGAAPRVRLTLRWPALAMALLWGFDLNLYTVAYLSDGWPEELSALRGLIVAVGALLMALGAAKGRAELRFRPSRTVAFQSFSLLLIGGYLVIMVLVAQWLSHAGGDFARLLQFSFLIVASTLAMVVLPSPRLRGWLRVMVTKHLFQHRYDYRAEWLRFTQTVGRAGDQTHPLQERVIQAVADITDSPAGLLLTPGDHGDMALAARWQWPTAHIPAVALGDAGVAFLESNGFIIDLEDIRAGLDDRGEAAIVPDWLREEPRAWAVVPLLHYERLVGVVVLARPVHGRKLDWEDFDLLRVVGQQLASYLAEHAGQDALAEAARFDDFHRRIAFVMHDIKNLASQLSLLARNAERHAEKPEFRADMLVTLRNSADKLNALLVRLSRYGGSAVQQLGEVSANDAVQAVAAQFLGRHPVMIGQSQPCIIFANAESLEQVLLHLVQNAVDASQPDGPVLINITSDGLHGCIEVVDTGHGMSAEFVRNKLFKPFVSSKPGGFGIGAYEARELVRAMQGRLEVESREGLGTRFIMRLPLAAARDILKSFATQDQKVA